MEPLIFISSPYSHPSIRIRNSNYRKVAKLAASLSSIGIHAISPIVYGHNLVQFKDMPVDWEFWKSFCLAFLDRCTAVLVYKMKGWDVSRGVSEEIKYALELNIPIIYANTIEESILNLKNFNII